jgi:hypothetical protein
MTKILEIYRFSPSAFAIAARMARKLGLTIYPRDAGGELLLGGNEDQHRAFAEWVADRQVTITSRVTAC